MSGSYNIGIRNTEDIAALDVNDEIKDFLYFLLNKFKGDGSKVDKIATVALNLKGNANVGIKIPRDLSGDTTTGEKYVKPGSDAYNFFMEYANKHNLFRKNDKANTDPSVLHSLIKGKLEIDLLSGNGKEGPSTSQQELLTSLVCWIKHTKKIKDISKKDFEGAYNKNKNYFNVNSSVAPSITVDKLWKIYETNDSGWRTSADTIADKFSSSFSNFKDINVYYGSNSGPLKKLYEISKSARLSVGLEMDANKWTPADVWFLTKEGATILQKLKSNISINDLNSLILKEIHNKNILPISLKKVGKTATVKQFNFDRHDDGSNKFPHSVDEIKNIKIKKLDNKGFFSTIAGSIEFTIDRPSDNIHLTEKVTARTFDGVKSFALEIDGVNAKGGKTNIKTLESLIRKICKVNVTIQQDYKLISDHLGNNKKPNPESLEEFYNKVKLLSNLATKHKILTESENLNSKFLSYTAANISKYKDKNHHSNFLNMDYKNFVTEFDKKAMNWRVSKFILVEMLYYIFNSPSGRNSNTQLKQIILELFQVASSQHEVSAPFYKIF